MREGHEPRPQLPCTENYGKFRQAGRCTLQPLLGGTHCTIDSSRRYRDDTNTARRFHKMKGSFTLALHVTALRDATLRYKNTKSVFMSAVGPTTTRSTALCERHY